MAHHFSSSDPRISSFPLNFQGHDDLMLLRWQHSGWKCSGLGGISSLTLTFPTMEDRVGKELYMCIPAD